MQPTRLPTRRPAPRTRSRKGSHGGFHASVHDRACWRAARFASSRAKLQLQITLERQTRWPSVRMPGSALWTNGCRAGSSACVANCTARIGSISTVIRLSGSVHADAAEAAPAVLRQHTEPALLSCPGGDQRGPANLFSGCERPGRERPGLDRSSAINGLRFTLTLHRPNWHPTVAVAPPVAVIAKLPRSPSYDRRSRWPSSRPDLVRPARTSGVRKSSKAQPHRVPVQLPPSLSSISSGYRGEDRSSDPRQAWAATFGELTKDRNALQVATVKGGGATTRARRGGGSYEGSSY